jgi:hypothetical protein
MEAMNIYIREDVVEVQTDKRGINPGKLTIRANAQYVSMTQVPFD